MPEQEGEALHDAVIAAGAQVRGAPLLEVGTYCGKSAIWLGAAAREIGTVLFTVDHHRGSEENQAGWEWHDESLVDPATGILDTMSEFRRTVRAAGLDDVVIAVVGESATVAKWWTTTVALCFIDGGHGIEPARADYEGWTPKVALGGTLAIHDVFAYPRDGGRPPYEQIYRPAIESGRFCERRVVGSLRLLERVA